MIREGEHPRTPTGLAHAKRAPRDLLVSAMESVEEADRQGQRPPHRAFDLVVDPHSKTLRGASKAPSASPTPTSVRVSSRTNTWRDPEPCGSGTTRPARKSADPRRSRTIVGNGMIRSGAINARSGASAI